MESFGELTELTLKCNSRRSLPIEVACIAAKQCRQYRYLQGVYIYQYGLTELQAGAEAYKIRSIDDTFFGCQSGLYLYYPQRS